MDDLPGGTYLYENWSCMFDLFSLNVTLNMSLDNKLSWVYGTYHIKFQLFDWISELCIMTEVAPTECLTGAITVITIVHVF